MELDGPEGLIQHKLAVLVLGLDWKIIRVFSNLNDSIILCVFPFRLC